MHLEVSFRNLRPRVEVRRRADVLFKKLHRFLDPAAEAQLVVAVEHGQAVLDAVVSTRGTTYKVHEEHEELRAALDNTFHTLEIQLRRAKEKRIDLARTPDEAEPLAASVDAVEE